MPLCLSGMPCHCIFATQKTVYLVVLLLERLAHHSDRFLREYHPVHLLMEGTSSLISDAGCALDSFWKAKELLIIYIVVTKFHQTV